VNLQLFLPRRRAEGETADREKNLQLSGAKCPLQLQGTCLIHWLSLALLYLPLIDCPISIKLKTLEALQIT
jgi:hypothetical protein